MPAKSESPARRPWRMEVPAKPSVAGPGLADAIIPAPSINSQLVEFIHYVCPSPGRAGAILPP